MTGSLGIRREDKSRWERRVPLTPDHVQRLVGEGVRVLVQPSPIRVFADDAYRRAGALVTDDLSGCNVIAGVKEMPESVFRPGGTYAFFSHTIKGQSHNMAMLRDLIRKRCQLIDYERIVDGRGARLVSFSRFAGLAGAIDTLWALGERLDEQGLEHPFVDLQPAHAYPSLSAAKEAVTAIGERIARKGLPATLSPLVVGIAGYGAVSRGVQEILACLPIVEMSATQLLQGAGADSTHRIVQVVFQEVDTVLPRDAARPFELAHFFAHPEAYYSRFADYLPHLSVLLNCIYWTEASPRLMTRADAKNLYGPGKQPKLRVIGDISCDIEGAVELTREATSQEAPVFVYDATADRAVYGVSGDGPVIMAVDNLPCELALESSEAFGEALVPFMGAVAAADYTALFGELELPAEIKGAVLLHHGEFPEPYDYMSSFLTDERDSK